MCGLAGIVSWDDRWHVTRDALDRMSAAIAHRGPDGQGLYLNHDREASRARPQCGLVHRRLAILDPDERALQPFDDGQGGWIAFNGEIYNFRELKEELSAGRPEYRWRTTCDTEVLLLAWRVWGEQCLEKLNGMFALAVWDQPGGALLLARDRMGQKPLYFSLAPENGAIAFGSELPALMGAPWIVRQIDPQALTDYLCWGYIPSPRTIWRGVAKLEPGMWMRVDAARLQQQRYFDPNAPVRGIGGWRDGEETASAATARLLKQAVRRQLVADVPLGCFLSGGVDSSVIAAAMRQAVAKDQPVLTFCIGFEDSEYDERAFARQVANRLGTEHREFVVRPHAAEDLPKLAAVFGEPFGDSSALPTHYLSQQTRQHVKVALSGDGGDELFGGYDRYRAMALAKCVGQLPGLVRAALGSRWWQRLPGKHPKSRLTRLKRLLAGINEPPKRRYASYMRLFDDAALLELLPADLHEAFATSRSWLSTRGGSLWDAEEVRAAMAVDRETYLPEDLLTKVDRASMLHALEVRSPFMDHELVHFAASLKAQQVLAGGRKRLLREAFGAELPGVVFRRRKMGFAVPIGRWLRGELRPMVHDLLGDSSGFCSGHLNGAVIQRLMAEHEGGTANHDQRLYALLMLELWWRAFGSAR